MNFLVLGDSNLRNAQQNLYQDEPLKIFGYIFSRFFKFFCFTFFESKLTEFFRAQYDGEGGRRSEHLIDLVEFAREFTQILVIAGDNDVKTQNIGYILQKILEFKKAVWPSKVKFAGHMRRGDLDPVLVAKNNTFLSENLGVNDKSTKLIKPNDFHDYDCHFDREGEGVSASSCFNPCRIWRICTKLVIAAEQYSHTPFSFVLWVLSEFSVSSM